MARWNSALPQRRLPRHLGQHAVADHLQHARHHGHDGRADASAGRRPGARPRAHRRSRCRCWAGRTGRRCARSCARRAGRTGRSRPCSRSGRSSSNAPRQFDRIERCGSITPFGRAAGAGGVDQAGQRRGGDAGRFQRDVVGRRGDRRPARPREQPTGEPPAAAPAAIHDHQQVQAAGRRPASRSLPARTAVETMAARAPLSRRICAWSVDRVGGVGGHRHGADRHQRGLGDRVFRAVLRDDHHPVAGGHPGGAQLPRAGRRQPAELAPGDAVPVRRRGRRAASACPARCGPGRTSSRPGSARSGSCPRFPLPLSPSP